MDKARILERFKKVAALAESGEGGEREVAHAMLDKFMSKYGICISDISISGANERLCKFKYKTKYERILICQTAGWVAQRKLKGKVVGRAMGILLNDEEFFLTEQALRILKKKWKDDLDLFFHAFIVKNDLFWHGQESKTEYDRERMNSVNKLAKGISAADLNLKKALQDK